MDLRDSVIEVLDRFYAMAGSNPPPEIKELNTENWHIALKDISDSAIEKGFNKAVSADIRRIPFPGEFKKFCLSSNPAKQYISQSEPDPVPAQDKELNNEHYKLLINKLKLPEVLKKKEFESFKRNRKKIESKRKAMNPSR